jgi:DNA-binding winged helix-turn-helix (wHTH) protein
MPPALYRFGAYEIDLPRIELRRAGETVPLQPKAWDLLVYLIRHRERVVTKDELLAALWPDVVVTEASLAKAVAAARRALGDSAAAQTCIETVRGRGFRFVAELEADEAARSPGRAPHGDTLASSDPFVGRADVLRAIDAALRAALEGSGRLLLLAGEAGIGKTRTAHEAASRGAAAGFQVISGWCHEAEGAPALWPWLVVLRQLLDGPEAGALTRGLGEGLAELAELLPALREHLPRDARAAPLEPAHARFRRLETVAEILLRAARGAPRLVVLDDFHRADPDSLALLRFLVHAFGAAPLALLVAHRADELPAVHPLLDLARAPGCAARGLAGLERAEIAELLRAELGAPVSEALAEAIRARTGGNPFFVKELGRALAAGGPVAVAGPEAAEAPLPRGVGALLEERLARLSADARALLVHAALLGPELDVALLARAGGETPERALALLDEACAEHVVQRGAGGLRFAHALLREALSESIPLAERARLHRRLGEALEAHYRDDLDPQLARLAQHFCAGAAAGCAERAVRYARLAGDRAVRLLDHREAAEHYRRGLAAEALLEPRDAHARCELLVALGEALMVAGEPDPARAALERAAEAARALGSPAALARAALAAGGLELSSETGIHDPALIALFEEALAALPAAEGQLVVRLRTRLGKAHYWSGAWERSIELIERAVADARKLGDPAALGHALYGQHWLDFVGPSARPGRDGADEMLELARGTRHRELELAAHSCRFVVRLQQGRSDEARHELARYDELAAQLRVPRYRWRSHFYAGALASLEGRFDDVEASAERTLAEEASFRPADAGQVAGVQRFWLRREQDRALELESAIEAFAARFPALATTLQGALALIRAEAGRSEEGRAGLAALLDGSLASAAPSFNRISELVLAADTCAALGEAALAERVYALLLPYRPRVAVAGAGVYCLGSVDLYLGRLAATAGRPEDARRWLEAALAAHERAGARPWLAWTQLELARLSREARTRRERERGCVLLAEAHDTAQALGMARLARRACELGDGVRQPA